METNILSFKQVYCQAFSNHYITVCFVLPFYSVALDANVLKSAILLLQVTISQRKRCPRKKSKKSNFIFYIYYIKS